MVKRALVGLLKGAIIGAILGLVIVYGLGMPVFAAWLAYLAAVVTGALTGLVAGRAIWEKGARIEAGLKAAAGAVVAAGAMFAIRKWLNVPADLGALGRGVIGDLPIASLPLIATGLALFFEIDNTGESNDPGPKKRVGAESPVRLAGNGAAEEEEIGEAADDVARSEEARRH